MILAKENVIVYTVQLDTEKVKALTCEVDITELFKHEFEKEGLTKEAALMDKGGFSYRKSESNSYYTEYKISITTRRKFL